MYTDSILSVAKELSIHNSTILVTGSTGLIGSCLVDVLILANEKFGTNNRIYALGRNKRRIQERFGEAVIPVVQDIIIPLDESTIYNYIIHCASNADPRSYATQPVETILTNIIGTKSVLDYCVKHPDTRMLFTSSFEVYGEVEGCDVYSEELSGIIDQTILRNGYPESKRSSELLMRSYVEEYSVDSVIVRLPSVYGPTMLRTDSKAHAQFINNALNGENIVLKSKGDQRRTYTYVVDAVSGMLCVLRNGKAGEVYNIANEKSVASIAEVAQTCAKIAGTQVVFDLPDQVEAKGFSRSKNCILDNTKVRSLGWQARFSLYDGMCETLEYLREFPVNRLISSK